MNRLSVNKFTFAPKTTSQEISIPILGPKIKEIITLEVLGGRLELKYNGEERFGAPFYTLDVVGDDLGFLSGLTGDKLFFYSENSYNKENEMVILTQVDKNHPTNVRFHLFDLIKKERRILFEDCNSRFYAWRPISKEFIYLKAEGQFTRWYCRDIENKEKVTQIASKGDFALISSDGLQAIVLRTYYGTAELFDFKTKKTVGAIQGKQIQDLKIKGPFSVYETNACPLEVKLISSCKDVNEGVIISTTHV